MLLLIEGWRNEKNNRELLFAILFLKSFSLKISHTLCGRQACQERVYKLEYSVELARVGKSFLIYIIFALYLKCLRGISVSFPYLFLS